MCFVADGGRIQFSSFVLSPPAYRHCGWSKTPRVNLTKRCEDEVTRARAALPRRKRRRAGADPFDTEAPTQITPLYPFAQGAFYFFSHALAAVVFNSEWTTAWVAAARKAAEGGRATNVVRWECAAEVFASATRTGHCDSD